MQKHYYGLHHLHYLTKSTYRRARVFDSERFKNQWVATLGELRRELGFKIVGYVLMPEHFRALIWPTAQANPSPPRRGAYIPTKSVGTYAPPAGCVRPLEAYNLQVSMQKHYYGLNHLHYLVATEGLRHEHLDHEEAQ
jgi:hypothetical protein